MCDRDGHVESPSAGESDAGTTEVERNMEDGRMENVRGPDSRNA